MAKFRKKPVVIEAFKMGVDNIPDWFMDKVTNNEIILRTDRPENQPDPFDHSYKTWCEIQTLEGVMIGNYGDMIIKGVNGECYPCKPDIFEKTYEAEDDKPLIPEPNKNIKYD